jgi:[acyl-carrier-protein] S-malonyltransferase
MGKSFYQSSPAGKAVFDQANTVLGYDLASLCFNGPAERLNQTDVSQPALFATGVASFRAAIETGILDAASVTAYAGLSLGEYTALHLAGAVSFEQGLKLVQRRGSFMQEAAVATPSGMVALIGGDEAAVRKICDQVSTQVPGSVLVPANFNTPGQIVVSGDAESCKRVVAVAKEAGVTAMPLVVAGAFHSPLMRSAAARMKEELDKADITMPKTAVYSNVTAQPHGDVESIKRLLVEQITQPVRWEQTMTTLNAAGEGRFIELAPGRTLAGLLKRINRKLVVEDNAGVKAGAVA